VHNQIRWSILAKLSRAPVTKANPSWAQNHWSQPQQKNPFTSPRWATRACREQSQMWQALASTMPPWPRPSNKNKTNRKNFRDNYSKYSILKMKRNRPLKLITWIILKKLKIWAISILLRVSWIALILKMLVSSSIISNSIAIIITRRMNITWNKPME